MLNTPGPQVLSVRDTATRSVVWDSYLDVLPPFRSGRNPDPHGLNLPDHTAAGIVAALVRAAPRNPLAPLDEVFRDRATEHVRV